MNFVLAAGGTGGHMVPAHALAAELSSRGHGVLVITDDRGSKIPGLFEKIPVHVLPAGRLGGGPIGLVKATFAIMAGRSEAKRIYRDHRPDAVVGFGGYPAFPALLAASAASAADCCCLVVRSPASSCRTPMVRRSITGITASSTARA